MNRPSAASRSAAAPQFPADLDRLRCCSIRTVSAGLSAPPGRPTCRFFSRLLGNLFAALPHGYVSAIRLGFGDFTLLLFRTRGIPLILSGDVGCALVTRKLIYLDRACAVAAGRATRRFSGPARSGPAPVSCVVQFHVASLILSSSLHLFIAFFS